MAERLETVSDVAELFLGNILFALELAAINMDEHQKPADAAFYRGIARKLAEARGREGLASETKTTGEDDEPRA